MTFEHEYSQWLESHRLRRDGERRRRLHDASLHAEKVFLQNVWWPTFHHFHHLHPEYEVRDYKDGSRFVDLAYIQHHHRLAIEIDGYGPHLREVDRWQFSDNLRRQNQLIIDGWLMMRFSYDDVLNHPRICQQMMQQLWSRQFLIWDSAITLTIYERDVVRLASRLVQPITPKDLCTKLAIQPKFAQNLLRSLVEKRWLQPHSGTVRIRSYSLHPAREHIRF